MILFHYVCILLNCLAAFNVKVFVVLFQQCYDMNVRRFQS